MKAGHAPIIVVRRIKKGHGHHGGAWKIAYADFVTAMMAFFIVMWLTSSDSRIKEAVAGYFQDQGALPFEQSNSVLQMGPGGIAPGAPGLELKKKEGEGSDPAKAEQDALSEAARKIKDKLIQLPDLASLRDQIAFSITSEGLRIELIEKNGSSFFTTGSAVLRGESVQILQIIAQEIGRLSNDIVVEGHTDRLRYRRGASYGNWELSSDRGHAARRVMETGGLRAGQIWSVRGFADTDLRVPDDPFDARNRRVSIVVRSHAAAALELGVPKAVPVAR
jgi:chemotaxis protein MotB